LFFIGSFVSYYWYLDIKKKKKNLGRGIEGKAGDEWWI
jgi:hypothetical protein